MSEGVGLVEYNQRKGIAKTNPHVRRHSWTNCWSCTPYGVQRTEDHPRAAVSVRYGGVCRACLDRMGAQ